MPALSLPPTNAPEPLDIPAPKAGKKGKKKSPAPNPEPTLIELTPDVDQGFDSPSTQAEGSGLKVVSLFDKVGIAFGPPKTSLIRNP